MYEIMAWKKPFAELTAVQVEKLYGREEFPDVSGILGANVIRKCWNEEFETAKDLEIALHAFANRVADTAVLEGSSWAERVVRALTATICDEGTQRRLRRIATILAGVAASLITFR